MVRPAKRFLLDIEVMLVGVGGCCSDTRRISDDFLFPELAFGEMAVGHMITTTCCSRRSLLGLALTPFLP